MGDCVRIGFYANENDGLLNVAVQILDEKEIKRIRERFAPLFKDKVI